MSIGKIGQFDVDSGNWTLYCERVELYYEANSVKEELKLPTLITLAGERTYELMVNLASPKKPSELKYAELVKLVRDHLQPQPSVMAERYRFRQRRQCKTENVTQYIATLKQLSRYCEFKNALEENLRDQFVCGVASDLIRQRLFAEESLTFAKAMSLANTLEAAERDAASVESSAIKETGKTSVSDNQTQGINVMKSGRRQRYGAISTEAKAAFKKSCSACGYQGHDASKCRYRNFVCDNCKVKGHLRRVCTKSSTRSSTRERDRGGNQRNFFASEMFEETQSGPEEEEEEAIWQMSLSEYRPVSLTVLVNKIPLVMEVDTGTPASCISRSTYEAKFSDLPIEKIKTCFNSYTGEKINPIGIISPIVQYRNKSKRLDLYVVEKGITTLIGRQWLSNFDVQLPRFKVKNNNMVNNIVSSDVPRSKTLVTLFDRYKDVFENGLGRYTGGTAQLRVRPDAQPVFHRARPMPYALRERVDAELDAMLREGVIEPVDCSDWATPLVPVHKKDGGLRVCADFKVTLNPVLLVDRYPLPKIQDVFANLAGGVRFSKIDLSQAYNQICLSEDSKPYTVINTHRGLFRYNRLVYGLSSSCGIFQRIINDLIQGIPNTQAFLDDLVITGPDEASHLRSLEAVLTRLQDNGLRVKSNKCVFLADEIKYLGYVVSEQGVKPDPTKLESIKKMPAPANVSELRSFLGMVNFYAKFVRNISSYLFPLYELLKKGRNWQWSNECVRAFNEVKELLSCSSVLAHYDPKQPLVLTCDASSRGVGGVLSQLNAAGVERPLAYVSRKLNSAEKAYSQIHREALAIVYCVKKYHQYLYGRHFCLRTDHKPLVSIFGPQKGIPCMAASRMQRWAIILSAYDYEITYVKSDDNGADALSRLPIDGPVSELNPSEQSYLNFASTALLLDCEEIRKQTIHDPIMSRVLNYITNGWPQNVELENLRPYWNRRSEIYTEVGCVMWGHRVIVPTACREGVLRELHEPHMGIVKTKAMARSYVWWPGLDEELEARCRACTVCAECAAAPPRAPPSPWRWPSRPYDRVHIDFLGPIDGATYLVSVDARSKWIEVFKMQRTTADNTIKRLRESWSRWGLPRQVVSDNGPPFSGKEFNEFLSNNSIKHLYSPPYHPASNGAAENAVKLIKGVIKKAKVAREDPDTAIFRFLLNYHNTPHTTTGETPAKLLQGRSLRTRMDALRPDLDARIVDKQQIDLTDNNVSQTDNRQLDTGDSVWYRNYNSNNKWLRGQILDKLGRNNYNVSSAQGGMHHRHVDQLKRCSRRSTCVYPEASEPEDAGSSGVGESGAAAGETATALVEQRVEVGSSRAPYQSEPHLADTHKPQINVECQPDTGSLLKDTSSSVAPEVRSSRLRKPVNRYGFEFD